VTARRTEARSDSPGKLAPPRGKRSRAKVRAQRPGMDEYFSSGIAAVIA
jgi:hypothetical protein